MVGVTTDPRQQIALFILGALGLLGRSWIPQKFCKGAYSGWGFVHSQEAKRGGPVSEEPVSMFLKFLMVVLYLLF